MIINLLILSLRYEIYLLRRHQRYLQFHNPVLQNRNMGTTANLQKLIFRWKILG